MSKQMETLTVAENDPPKLGQVRKIWQRVVTSARKLGATAKMFQTALAYPGTELEDTIVATIVRLAKKATGIVTPVRAVLTGLIPANWLVQVKDGVEQDFPEGEVDLTNLDYDYCPVREGEPYVDGDTMLARAVEVEVNAIGSLGFAKELLKAQDEGKEIFPVESRGKVVYLMPLTVLLDDVRDRRVACFDWDRERWVLDFDWFDDSFNPVCRFVRRCESAKAKAEAGE